MAISEHDIQKLKIQECIILDYMFKVIWHMALQNII